MKIKPMYLLAGGAALIAFRAQKKNTADDILVGQANMISFKAMENGQSQAMANALALDYYRTHGGVRPMRIKQWQVLMGVPATGKYDAATMAVMKDSDTLDLMFGEHR